MASPGSPAQRVSPTGHNFVSRSIRSNSNPARGLQEFTGQSTLVRTCRAASDTLTHAPFRPPSPPLSPILIRRDGSSLANRELYHIKEKAAWLVIENALGELIPLMFANDEFAKGKTGIYAFIEKDLEEREHSIKIQEGDMLEHWTQVVNLMTELREELGTESCTPVVALIYLDRAFRSLGRTLLDEENFERLIVISSLIAQKQLFDTHSSNGDWEYEMDYCLHGRTINQLEIAFLSTLQFETHVDQEEYDKYYAILKRLHKRPYAPSRCPSPVERGAV